MRDSTRTKVEAVQQLVKNNWTLKDALKAQKLSGMTYYKGAKQLKKEERPKKKYPRRPKMQIAEIAPVSMQSEKTLFILTSDHGLIQTMLNNFRG